MEPNIDDPRAEELEALEAIFPEIRRVDKDTDYTFELDLPVEPVQPVPVTFSSAEQAPGMQAAPGPRPAAAVQLEEASRVLSHLPRLTVRITLPHGYPSEKPPLVVISTTPQWLPLDVMSKLECDASRLWEEAGRDLVVYTYMDHLHQLSGDAFGIITSQGSLEVDQQHKLAVLDYDIQARRAAFERQVFDCGVCLDHKKGSDCHKMLDCGHVFCLQCLREFYTDAIQQGQLDTVRCSEPNCARKRAKAQTRECKLRTANVSVSPGELLQIGLSEEMIKRFVAIKYKMELEADKNTVYCPRKWCNGAARSKRHRKPSGLELYDLPGAESGTSGEEAQDDEAEEDERSRAQKKFRRTDLLSVCEECEFAFCRRCFQTWHGEFVACCTKQDVLAAEEKLTLEYIKLHTSPCPTCDAPAQKTHGCNHMICSRCLTHFCYLCSAWLDPSNPYQHYNTRPDGSTTSCYMRLWELEDGDGDEEHNHGAVGGRARPIAVNLMRVAEAEALNNIMEDGDEVPAERGERAYHGLNPNGQETLRRNLSRDSPLLRKRRRLQLAKGSLRWTEARDEEADGTEEPVASVARQEEVHTTPEQDITGATLKKD